MTQRLRHRPPPRGSAGRGGVGAEIARLDAKVAKLAARSMRVNAGRIGEKAFDARQEAIADEIEAETDAERIAVLTRAYVISGLVHNTWVTD